MLRGFCLSLVGLFKFSVFVVGIVFFCILGGVLYIVLKLFGGFLEIAEVFIVLGVFGLNCIFGFFSEENLRLSRVFVVVFRFFFEFSLYKLE